MLLCTLALAFSPQLPAEWIDAFLEGSRALERGELEPAKESFVRVQKLLPGHAPSAYQLAYVHAFAGEVDAALAWLENAHEAGGLDAAQLAWDPWLVALREDPRFEALLDAAHRARAELVNAASELIPDGRIESVATSADGAVRVAMPGARLLDPGTGELVAALELRGERVREALVDPRGRWVALHGERDADRVPFLRVHGAATGDLVREIATRIGWHELQTDAAGERLLARGGTLGSVALFETHGWEELDSPPIGVTEARLSPDGARALLVYPRNDGQVDTLLWDVDEGRVLERREGVPPPPLSQANDERADEPDPAWGAQLDTNYAVARSTHTAWVTVGDGSLRELDSMSGRTLRSRSVSDGALRWVDLCPLEQRLVCTDEHGATGSNGLASRALYLTVEGR